VTSAATETHPGETPILDREIPLPPRKIPGHGLALLLTLWYGAIIVFAACFFLGRPPMLRRWLLTEAGPWGLDQWERIGIVGVAGSVLATYYLMIAVHELGHVIAGLSVGFRLRSYRVGPLVFIPPFRVTLYRGPGAFVNGVAELIPVATDKLARRGIVMILGGPAANLLSALAVILLPIPTTVFSVCFIAFSIVNGVNDLFPFESRLGVSDGRRIGMLLRQGARGERWLALARLGAELNDGVPPESFSADFLAKAVAVRDESADTVIAHALAYSAAFHQHKDGEAGRRLETCLAYSSHAMPFVREALMSDAAVFQGRRRKRADLAEQWLADIPVATQGTWLRTRAEAAILEARGDVRGALGKLAEVEAAIATFPNQHQRDTLLRSLQRWKLDLGRRLDV
jgi:peptidase M50-like protein